MNRKLIELVILKNLKPTFEYIYEILSNLKIKLIEPYHYEEIVEERFLAKLCGYSSCSNELKNVSKNKSIKIKLRHSNLN